LNSLETGEEFAAPVTIGGQNFTLAIDTGSSDTWVVEKGFRCYDIETERLTSESECAFGPSYTKSSTFTPISGEEFTIQYGDGEALIGSFGTEDGTIAGLTVNQEIAVVTEALWEGDGTTSGLMGLAYPALYVFPTPTLIPPPDAKLAPKHHSY
jgi:aspergillopepsin I